MWARVAVALTGAVLLGGCGGGSTTTITVGGSITHSDGKAQSHKVASKKMAPSPGQQFEAFLVKIRPIRHAGNAQLARCNKVYRAMSLSDYTGWTAAGKCSNRASKVDSNVADRLAAIVPPPALRRPYLAYARSWRIDAEIYSDLASTIDNHEYLDWNKFDARFNAPNDRDAIAGFRVAVIAYGAARGYWVPKWVHTIGT